MPRSLYFALLSLSLIWGGSFFFIKILLHDYGPWTIAFFRSAFGLAVIIAVMLIMRKPFDIRKIRWIPMAVMALINTAIPWAFIGFAETKLTSGMASVLNATTPLWTVIIGVLFFGAVTNRLQWLGMIISLAGLLILVGVNPVSIISVDPLGAAGMIAATLCYAVGSHLSKRLKGLSMYQVTFGTLISAMIGSGIVALLVEPDSLLQLPSAVSISALIGLGVFGSGFAYILFYFLIQKGSPEFATMVTYLVPVSAIVWGYALLNEDIHWSLLTGLAFILAGVFLASKKSPRKADGCHPHQAQWEKEV
ncbi:DMT family transporter [Paenibacillus caui]|uniref:DMT family transporter n=1 Tax=Paenibacillus caui TaxID=2873927 RepID=UPI001CA819A2